MKLTPEEAAKLVAATGGQPVAGIIGDACELLTLKVVMLLKQKANEYRQVMEKQPAGTPERLDLASRANALSRFMVELAEMP